MSKLNNQTESGCEFSLTKYLESLEESIKIILLRPQKNVLTYDILDTEKDMADNLIALKQTQLKMKRGEIWQEVLGTYNGFINLKTGHETALCDPDIHKDTARIITINKELKLITEELEQAYNIWTELSSKLEEIDAANAENII